MAKFLEGKQLGKKIRKVTQADTVRCAVAFWGGRAVSELFGEDSLSRDDVWVVCDISMGATNPETLEALGAPKSKQLRHAKNLHAKLYHSDAGMVITSANASSNGVGFMGGDADLTEIGVFEEATTASWLNARDWFDDLWKQSFRLDHKTLESERKKWDERYRSRGLKNPPAWKYRPTIIETLRDSPGIFDKVKFVLSDSVYSNAEKDEVDREAEDKYNLKPDRTLHYYFSARNTPEEEWPDYFIDFSVSRKRVHIFAYRKVMRIDDTQIATREKWIPNHPYLGDLCRHMKKDGSEEIIKRVENLNAVIEEYRIWTGQELSDRLFRE